MDRSQFERCFEKHTFNELNNIDCNIFDESLKYFYKYNKEPEPVFFDVGCNAGSFIKVLDRNKIKQNIHCFEPHPMLSKKVLDKYPHIAMNDICLTDNIGNIDINIPLWSVGLSSIINRPIFNTLTNKGQDVLKLNVNTNTIDNYCKENQIDHIDFIKIDVEGAEKIVLQGAINMLKHNKIKMGLFEIGDTLIDANTSNIEISHFLESFNYKIVKHIQNNYLFHL